MASAEELVAHIEVGKSQVGEDKAAIAQTVSGVEATVTQIAAAKSHAEELSTQLQGMNISGKASQALEVASKLDEAIAQAGIVKSQAEQVNTAADGVNAKLDEAITAAQAMMGLLAAPSSGSNPSTTRMRESSWRNETRQPTQSLQPGPAGAGAFQQELASTDGADAKMSKPRRVGRALARNFGDIKAQAKETSAARIDDAGTFRPIETVGVPQHHEAKSHEQTTPVADLMVTGVLLTAVTIDAFARLANKFRHNRQGQ